MSKQEPAPSINFTPELIKQIRPIVCTNCGQTSFIEIVTLGKLSRIAAATPEDIIIPKKELICLNCSTVLTEYKTSIETQDSAKVETKETEKKDLFT